MRRFRLFLSSLLLAAGVLLVFVGLGTALGGSLPGAVASLALVAALLYAGGAWFGGAPLVGAEPGTTARVFDRHLRVTAGPGAGGSVLDAVPAALAPDVERRCRAALDGDTSHLTCDLGSGRALLEFAPVGPAPFRFGLLVTRTAHAPRTPAAAPAPIGA